VARPTTPAYPSTYFPMYSLYLSVLPVALISLRIVCEDVCYRGSKVEAANAKNDDVVAPGSSRVA